MSDIQRYDIFQEEFKNSYLEECANGDLVKYKDHAAIVAQLEERNSGLEAARLAYASEFPLNSKGEPDVGSIHQNIRKLKADYAQLEADLADARKDQARYQYVYEWLEQKVQGTKDFFRAKTKEQYNVAIDAAIKEQGK